MAADLVVVVAEEVAEEEEVDLVAEVVAEVDLEVRGSKCCCLEGVCSEMNPKPFLGLWCGANTEH